MTDAFKSIEQGLKEALLCANGKRASFVFQADLSEKGVPQTCTPSADEDPRAPLAKSKASKSRT